jgi:hypothetical protein
MTDHLAPTVAADIIIESVRAIAADLGEVPPALAALTPASADSLARFWTDWPRRRPRPPGWSARSPRRVRPSVVPGEHDHRACPDQDDQHRLTVEWTALF